MIVVDASIVVKWAVDCIYLAVALDRGPLVTADDRFAKKCVENDLGAFIASPSDLRAKSRDWAPFNPTSHSH